MRELEKLARAEVLVREARALVIEAGARGVRQRIDTTLGEIAKVNRRSQYQPHLGRGAKRENRQ